MKCQHPTQAGFETPVVKKLPVDPTTSVNAASERNGLKRRPVAFTVDR